MYKNTEMLSSREQALLLEQEPDLTIQHQGAVGTRSNAIGDHYRWWAGLTPEQQEKFRELEKENSKTVNREV